MTAKRADFDRIARPYRALEYITLGRALERTRLHFLPTLDRARNALVLGDGDGRFLDRLLAENLTLSATAVDSSATMLDLLRKRTAHYSDRLQIHQADALSFTPAASEHYDLVVTHFFLDCLTQDELRLVVERITPFLTPRAVWVVSDFRIPEGMLRLPAQAFVRALYLGFRLLTGLRTTRLPDHASALTEAGFTCLDRKLMLAGVLVTELWQAGSNNIE